MGLQRDVREPRSPGARGRRPQGRWADPWWRGAAAVLAGALPALAFPAPALWWFAYTALVPWLLLARSAPTWRRAALDGWLGGLGFMLAVHHWLLPSLHVFTVLIAALLGALWAPWGLLVRRMLGGAPSARRASAAPLVVASGWLVIELVRSWQGLGGPWGLLGSSQWQVAPALRLASLGGVWLLSLLVVVVNTALALLLVSPPARTPAVGALGALGVAAAVTGGAWAWAPQPVAAGHTRIAVVQAGIVRGPDNIERRFDLEERLTRRLAGRPLDLVVWGESSVGFDLAARPDLVDRVAALSRLVGADILVNVDAYRTAPRGKARAVPKSSVLVGPEGPAGERYDKMRLVPFGEYVPARSLLGWATSMGRAAGEDRGRGTHQVVVETQGTRPLRLGPLVCFESAFPDMSRHLAADGANVLVVQSSTSSFQGSWAPRQHASLAALRAAETGRPMVHATLTGVSAVFGPDGGRVGAALGTDTSAAVAYDVPLASGVTPYVRFGDWVVHGALLVLLAVCGWEGRRLFRRPVRVSRARSARTDHGSPARPGH